MAKILSIASFIVAAGATTASFVSGLQCPSSLTNPIWADDAAAAGKNMAFSGPFTETTVVLYNSTSNKTVGVNNVWFSINAYNLTSEGVPPQTGDTPPVTPCEGGYVNKYTAGNATASPVCVLAADRVALNATASPSDDGSGGTCHYAFSNFALNALYYLDVACDEALRADDGLVFDGLQVTTYTYDRIDGGTTRLYAKSKNVCGGAETTTATTTGSDEETTTTTEMPTSSEPISTTTTPPTPVLGQCPSSMLGFTGAIFEKTTVFPYSNETNYTTAANYLWTINPAQTTTVRPPGVEEACAGPGYVNKYNDLDVENGGCIVFADKYVVDPAPIENGCAYTIGDVNGEFVFMLYVTCDPNAWLGMVIDGNVTTTIFGAESAPASTIIAKSASVCPQPTTTTPATSEEPSTTADTDTTGETAETTTSGAPTDDTETTSETAETTGDVPTETTETETTTTTTTTVAPATNVSFLTILWENALIRECNEIIDKDSNNKLPLNFNAHLGDAAITAAGESLKAWCNYTSVTGNHTCVVTFADRQNAVKVTDAANNGAMDGVYSASIDNEPTTTTAAPGPSDDSSEDKKRRKALIIGIGVGGAILAVVVALGIVAYIRRKANREAQSEAGLLNEEDARSVNSKYF